MSHTLTEVSQFDAGGVSVPDTADPRTAASVEVPFQDLTDRTRMLLDAVLTSLDWTRDFGVRPGGALNSFTLDIGAIGGAVVSESGTYYVRAYGGGTINQTKIEGGGGTLGAVARWWHVYVFRSGGSVDFEISQTPPNVTRRYKGSDTTRRYLGSFPTTSAGKPLALVASNGHYRYLMSGNDSTDPHRVLVGNATSFTAQSCSAVVPTWARVVRLYCEFLPGASGRAFYLRTTGTSTHHRLFVAPSSNAYDVETGLELDTSQSFDYQVANSADSLTAYVTEFEG